MRLTRLNIYSGLYLEWARTRVLIDPAKVPLQAVAHLDPHLILVSHESMDHFDPGHCVSLLSEPGRRLIGSWAVLLSLTDHLAPDDPRWTQILPAIAGCRYQFGDLVVDVHRSLHCEYAAPVFFEITDATSGVRLVDAIDTAITPEMSNGTLRRAPDLLIAPAGIALGVSPDTAWEMARLLEPAAVMASHLTRERAGFVAQAGQRPAATEQVYAPDWHEAIVVSSGDPQIPSGAEVRVSGGPVVDRLVASACRRPDVAALLHEVQGLADAGMLAHALYALSAALARGGGHRDTMRVLDDIHPRVLASAQEPLLAAWLLAWGLALRASAAAGGADLDRVAALLSPDQPYLGYWVLECWGRAAANPALTAAVQSRLVHVAATDRLWNAVGLRRKLMWEVERLVRGAIAWPGLPALLTQALADANPDVRLLAFRILPLATLAPAERRTLLRAGLSDPHEDVLEEAIAAHIALFDALTDDERATARARHTLVADGPTFHVRERANVLMEMLSAPTDLADGVPPPRRVGVGVQV